MEITTKILEIEGKVYLVSYYPNDVRIDKGDLYLYWFGGWSIGRCDSDHEYYEINSPDREKSSALYFVYKFWRDCYKIYRTNYKLEE